jgi:hypothetical protein
MSFGEEELELSRVSELTDVAHILGSRQSKMIGNNGKKGIWLRKEDFICDLKL